MYKLSGKLGGRKEVLNVPAVELLGYLNMAMTEQEQEAEKERARAWIQFLIQTYTAPSFGKPDAQFEQGKKAFIETLKPKAPEERGPAKVYQWDEEIMKRAIEQQQKGVT